MLIFGYTLFLFVSLFSLTQQEAAPSLASSPAPLPLSDLQQFPGVRQLVSGNFSSTLDSHDVVFINFYADWCHFSGLLMPIFEETAIHLVQELPKSANVCLARVDCLHEEELCTRCGINKFPTLRLYSYGYPQRREYRGKRSVKALTAYVEKQLRPAVRRFNEVNMLDLIDARRRSIIAFFKNRKHSALAKYELLAMRHKNDCDFYMRVGQSVNNITYTEDMPNIVYRPDVERTHAEDELFAGDITNDSLLEEWIIKKCIPLVREVDFYNVEEIIEQNLPLLVLFHLPLDVISVKDFKSIVEMQLASCADCGHFNFVTVDGLKFEHSVNHMGKTTNDLPLIAIDSLKFMFPYTRFMDMYIPDHLKQFLRNFAAERLEKQIPTRVAPAGEYEPPESTFKHLGPSKHRYTLVAHDEL